MYTDGSGSKSYLLWGLSRGQLANTIPFSSSFLPPDTHSWCSSVSSQRHTPPSLVSVLFCTRSSTARYSGQLFHVEDEAGLGCWAHHMSTESQELKGKLTCAPKAKVSQCRAANGEVFFS